MIPQNLLVMPLNNYRVKFAPLRSKFLFSDKLLGLPITQCHYTHSIQMQACIQWRYIVIPYNLATKFDAPGMDHCYGLNNLPSLQLYQWLV